MSTLQVDRIIPYQSSSVLVEGLSAPNLATTGSNTFVGNQIIQGTITASIQEGFALVGGVGNVSTLVATSSFGGALPSGVVSGSTQITELGFATTGSNTFTGTQTLTGNLNITPIVVSDAPPVGFQKYVIPILSGSNNTLGRDAGFSLYWVPTPNTLAVSSSAGIANMSPGGGVNAYDTVSRGSSLTSTIISNAKENGRYIGISGNPSLSALTGLSTITNPGIVLQSGSVDEFEQAEYYTPIQFQSSQSFSDGRVTITTPLVAQQGAQITGVATQTFDAPADNTQNDIAAVNNVNIDGTAYTNIFFGMQNYPSAGDAFKDAWIYDYWTDFNFETGSDFIVNPKRVGGTLALSGSGGGVSKVAISQLRDLAGKTFLNQYANIINIGAFAAATTDLIYIGHATLPVLRLASANTEMTGSVSISGSNGLQVTGSVGISQVLTLAGQDPLPAGGVGQLAVSASNLWYHNGSSWTQIN